MIYKRKTLKEMAEKARIDKIIKEALAMRDEDPLAELFSMVGCHLTGLKVFVRLREPYKKSSRGIMLPCGNGRVTIDINPDQDLAGKFWTFLHETAHARKHYYNVDTGSVLSEPGSVTVDYSEYKQPANTKKEAEANDQAQRWQDFSSDPDRLAEVGYHPANDEPVEFSKLHVLARIKTYNENGEEK